MTRSTIVSAAQLALALAVSAASVTVFMSAPAVAQGAGQITSYGKYCGPGVPAFTAAIGETEGRLADLASFWAPADDLDALCYSHDYCFEMLGMDSITCDNAIEATFQSFASTFQASQPACAAQATNMAEAFRLKVWSKDDAATGGGAGRLGGMLQGLNNMRNLGGNDARDAAVRQAFAEVAARDCNIGAAPNPQAAIDQFVAQVRAQGVSDFTIATPAAAASGN